MKIVICTTPIRPVPTSYPPFGSLAVIQSLRGAGYDPVFVDIDGLRPPFADVLERFREEAPDVIGISAVVSTAYGYVKKLCLALKAALPGVKIVVGGNLAASAELLHRFCKVDVCAIGEGEPIIVRLVDYYARRRGREEHAELEKIRGITYLGPGGDMVFTGYDAAIPAKELLDPDFAVLETYSNIDNFISDPFARWDFAQDPRSREPHRVGNKMATVVSAKGCVARCTFCHRWEKGFRQIPPTKVIRRIEYLIDRYNVGFVLFGDENFGSDLKALDELICLLEPLDLLWVVSGIRARTLDLGRLKRMRDAGCAALYYGFETGSPDILKVMEKNLKLADNFNAARWTHEAGLFTVYQLVLGMPGETHQTISETIEMVKRITEFLPEPPYKYLSTNYIQALPGTPVYEYARATGLIGPSLADEDRYLLAISDVEAGDDTKFLNFTEHPYLTVQSWRPRILYEATAHWHRVRRNRQLAPSSPSTGGDFKPYEQGGYFNVHDFRRSPLLLRALYPIRWLPIWLWTLVSVFRRSSNGEFSKHLWEWVVWPFVKKPEPLKDYRSLRNLMRDVAPRPTTLTEESAEPLRLGR